MRSLVPIGRGIVCLVVMTAGLAQGQDDRVAEEAKAWQARRVTEFAKYHIQQVSPQGEVPVMFEKASALSWSNPIRKTAAGAVFLWTIEGRPQLIASTYPYEQGIEQEFTSLSPHPLLIRSAGGETHHMTPGVEWKDVPDAEPPHKQRALRLTQMRRIAERFRVQGSGDNKFETRLLTQPVYRSPVESKIDTAVFTFVQVTDPEAILILETTETSSWRYALARMTTFPIVAHLDDQPVWELPSCYYTRMNDNLAFRTLQIPGAK